MISKVNIFIVTIFVLLVTNAGFAQEDITDENRLGTAYEFNGVSRFITFPSKFLFGNPEVLEAEIVVGYQGNLFEIVNQCNDSMPDYQIILGRVESEWWNESTYTNIPQSVVSDWTDILLEEFQPNQSWLDQSSSLGIPQSVVSAWPRILLEESQSNQSLLLNQQNNQDISQSVSPVNSWEDLDLAPDTIAHFDVAILDNSEQPFEDECITKFDRKQFLVDERIVQLTNAAGLQSGINNLQ